MSTTTALPPTSTSTATATASCVTAVPGEHGSVPRGSCNSNWNYDPQIVPSAVFAIVFIILTVAHLVLAIITKKPYCWVLIMGVAWEAVGWSTGYLGAKDQQKSAYAQIMQILTYLAPLWVNAFAYMTLGRMIHYFIPDRRIWVMKGRLLGRSFVLADITCFIIQRKPTHHTHTSKISY